MNDFKNYGHQKILLQIDQSKLQDDENIIRIHASEIKIEKCDFNSVVPEKIDYDEENQEIHFVFSQSLKQILAEENILSLQFTGYVNDKMKGLYRSQYKNADNQLAWSATTHMEPTGARLAFPCFDEPSFRPVWKISVKSEKDKTVLSNMDIKSVENLEENGEDLKITHFNPTPPMPSYLVAFIVGEFDYLEKSTKNNIPIRVFTPPGQKEKGRLALDYGVKCVDFYEEFFDIKYPLPKMDMIGIQDYPLGGMENWGLITYSMKRLIYEEGVDSLALRSHIFELIAHEIAHMWFGNFVTIEWWTHLWIKEGFATFMQYYSTARLDQVSKPWDSFYLRYWVAGYELENY